MKSETTSKELLTKRCESPFCQAVERNNVTLPSTLEEIMNRWILQMGFPVVTINTNNGHVTQKHFLLDKNAEVTTSSPYK